MSGERECAAGHPIRHAARGLVMASIADPVAAQGQWAPSPFKSGKPGSKSMPEHFPFRQNRNACFHRQHQASRLTGSRKGKRVDQEVGAQALISIKTITPVIVLMGTAILRSTFIPQIRYLTYHLLTF
jgi:hypothetical protein